MKASLLASLVSMTLEPAEHIMHKQLTGTRVTLGSSVFTGGKETNTTTFECLITVGCLIVIAEACLVTETLLFFETGALHLHKACAL